MGIRKTAMAVFAAASMIAVPTIAAAQPVSAAKLSVAGARSGASTKGKNDVVAGGVIIAILAAAAVVAGIIVAADNNDSPASA